MNVKSIYETLTALGTGALIVGCGASQSPVNTAEQPPAEHSSASATNSVTGDEAASAKVDAPAATTEEKPSNTTAAAASPTPAGASPAAATPAAATPAATTPTAAKATPVKKPSATGTTGKTTGKKKDAGSACGEGGCG